MLHSVRSRQTSFRSSTQEEARPRLSARQRSLEEAKRELDSEVYKLNRFVKELRSSKCWLDQRERKISDFEALLGGGGDASDFDSRLENQASRTTSSGAQNSTPESSSGSTAKLRSLEAMEEASIRHHFQKPSHKNFHSSHPDIAQLISLRTSLCYFRNWTRTIPHSLRIVRSEASAARTLLCAGTRSRHEPNGTRPSTAKRMSSPDRGLCTPWNTQQTLLVQPNHGSGNIRRKFSLENAPIFTTASLRDLGPHAQRKESIFEVPVSVAVSKA